ncbi:MULTISPECIES: DUF6894 family protein [Rhizobium]|uniref:DUF6894 family protein n=1 Tax=Rhizobium TaxID=379 RepID=UPI001C9119A2|nr:MULTISPECIES: hypothetical protein [Rhizobium]MBY3445507.1 hypothetical protein [Rhizobium laguerreae]MBY5533056.1 hypothetical protein [Rhizobium leguminosarum]MBY5587900.1 hypothetical protein [Rhizobium leguminosarum]MBY5605191.1 hypothetical protein [Rhizobium leguminosarum]
MARYYFHIRQGETIIAEDLQGLEFATPEMAVEEATKAARELVVEMILAGNRVGDQEFEIRSSDGAVVKIVPFKSAAGLE